MKKVSKFDKVPGIVTMNDEFDESKIKKIEDIIDFKLSEGYINFLKHYNGGYTNDFGYKNQEGEVFLIQSFYGILKETMEIRSLDLKRNILSKYYDLKEFYGMEKILFIPIGMFEGGLSILMDKEGRVYVQDDRNLEEFKIDKIADDFESFFREFVKERIPKEITKNNLLIKRIKDDDKRELMFKSLKEDEKKKKEKKYTPLEDLYS